jgi:protein O-mannosyl-transferase
MQKLLSSGLKNHLGLLVLLMATIFIYMPSLSGDFVIDDIPFVRDNPYIRNIGDIERYFTKGVWENSVQEIKGEPLYRPMNLMPMLLNHALWGNNPFGYHAFLLLLHLANTCLVYVLIRKLVSGSAMAAMFGAGVFALHPARVESVAWISGGIDPLVALFLLSAMLAHRVFADNLNSDKKWRYLGLSLICFQLALWSKEVAFIFPLVVLAHDLIYRRKIQRSVILLQTMVIVGYLIARNLALGKVEQLSAIDLSQFSKVMDFALGYIEILVLPVHIPFYIKPPEHSVSSMLGIFSAIILVALIGFAWRSFDVARRKDLMFSIVWAIGFFWPGILLAFYTDGFFAGRYLYVPMAGVAIFVAILYDYLNVAYPRLRTSIMASCVLIVACYGLLTWKAIPAWHDNETIYTKVTQDAPEEALGFRGLGQFYFNREDYASAEKNYLLALQKSRTPDSRVDSLVALGTINGIKNNLAQSESYLQEAIKIDPKNSDAWSGLGNLAWVRGQSDQAISLYEKALSIKPGNHEAAVNLASLYDKTGRSQLADMVRKQAAAYQR